MRCAFFCERGVLEVPRGHQQALFLEGEDASSTGMIDVCRVRPFCSGGVG